MNPEIMSPMRADRLDATFAALAEPTRRAILAREMGMRGTFREIVPGERLVVTELLDEDWTGGETLSTIVLSEKGGRTMVTNTVLYASRQARDGALKTGMERGVAASYDRLADILASTAHGAERR